jgi:digeranylgeranylglycerophospholipid reductase
VSPATGGGIHMALRFGRRAAQLVSDFLSDRGPHPVAQLAREAPRFRGQHALRRILDTAPPNALINALLMTPPVQALAQRLYFHSRATGSYDDWAAAFEQDAICEEPPGRKLRLI